MNAAHHACGCGGGGCGSSQAAVPSINGVALHAPGGRPDEEALRERAWGELLRQEAVRQGLLPQVPVAQAPQLSADAERQIHAMLMEAVPLRQPDAQECRRYYDANKRRFVAGQRVHLRHILFAVTDGVDVHQLAVRAEQALLELMRRGTPPTRFGELARELSNCPSGREGGDLGWIGPEDCAEELANELFHLKEPLHGMGLHPRLVHSRYGLHIVEVLGRRQGRPVPFEQVHDRIAMDLAQRSRATALHQYIRLLAGQARVEGIALEAAATPLVQ